MFWLVGSTPPKNAHCIVIVGGGATGTELAAEPPRILPGLPEPISAATSELLAQIGMEVHAGTRMAEVRADGVLLAESNIFPAELTV